MQHAQGTDHGEHGVAMVTLLVAMALMAIFMSAALPAWRHAAQREKEAELIWRGEQYDRAVQLYRRKFAAPGPPNLDILLEQRMLRRKYTDPITGGDFEIKPVGPGGINMPPGAEPPGGQPPRTRPGGRPARAEPSERPGSSQRTTGQLIGGVRSKSKAKSIRLLNGRDRYDQWEFAYIPYNPDPQPAAGPLQQGQPGSPTRPGATRPGTRTPGSPPGSPRQPQRPDRN